MFLLRDFDEELFQASHSPELIAENDRLEALNVETKKWWQYEPAHSISETGCAREY